MTTHVNRDIDPRVKVVESTMKSTLKYFVRMNTFIFLASMVGEDLQEFLDCVYMVLSDMGVTSMEKEK